MASYTVKRFIALSILGCLFLVIYQVVFLARTSAARDWNHLHNSHFTLPQVQRFVVHNVDQDTADYFCNELTTNSPQEVLKRRFKMNSGASPNPVYVKTVRVDGSDEVLPSSRYTSVFRVGGKAHTIKVKREDVGTVMFNEDIPFEIQLEDALKAHKKAVLYIVPLSWVPVFGSKKYPVPIAAVHHTPVHWGSEEDLTFSLEKLAETAAAELTIPGLTSDFIVVGDARSSIESTAAFATMAEVFRNLYLRGWKPLRGIHFVSFPQFSGNNWAEKHRKWLRRRAVAYIDTGGDPFGSVSPLLRSIAAWAAEELIAGGVLMEEDFLADPIHIPLGSSAFQLDYQIPSMSYGLEDVTVKAKLLNLIIACISQEPTLPFRLRDYAEYLGSDEYAAQAAEFDAEAAKLRIEFTREYPWYELKEKFKALITRKLLNKDLRDFEAAFRGHDGSHVVFVEDPSRTHTVARQPDSPGIRKAVKDILRHRMSFI